MLPLFSAPPADDAGAVASLVDGMATGEDAEAEAEAEAGPGPAMPAFGFDENMGKAIGTLGQTA